MELPEFNTAEANIRYRLNDDGVMAGEYWRWSEIEQLFTQFEAANKYVISAPM